MDLTKRLRQYYSQGFLTKELKKGNSAIYRALLKYGYLSFKLEILEYCEPGNVVTREQYYLDLLEPDYNLLPTAGSPYGYKHTEEAKANMRAAHVGRELSELQLEHLAKLKAENLGRKHREETKAKTKATMLTFWATSGSSSSAQAILVTDSETGETTLHSSATRAAAAIGCNKSTVLSRISGNSLLPIHDRFIVQKPSNDK